jgi:hypothetical protein
MKRTGPPARKSPLRQTSDKKRLPDARKSSRKAERHSEAFAGQAALCRSLPCCICFGSPSDPHHVRSRGAGGKDEDTVPLCRLHHTEVHQKGAVTFWRSYGMDPQRILEWVRAQVTPATDRP